MAEIGKTIRRGVMIPLKNPVPQRQPIKVPTEPVKVPEKEPVRV